MRQPQPRRRPGAGGTPRGASAGRRDPGAVGRRDPGAVGRRDPGAAGRRDPGAAGRRGTSGGRGDPPGIRRGTAADKGRATGAAKGGRRTRPGERSTQAPDRRGQVPARAGRTPSGQGRGRDDLRRGLGGELVEGRRAVLELLLAGRRRTRDVWLAEGSDPATILDEIVEAAERARVTLRRVARARLDAEARTEAPQGVLAHADPLPETDFEALCGAGTPPFLLALDGVTDPQNLGALLRSALGAGVTGVVLPRHRASHVTPAVTKAAAGAIEYLPMSVVPGLPASLARARALGLWVVGLDGEGDQLLFDLDVAIAPVLLVLGGEGSGLSRLARQRCDLLARIPLCGPVGSLNVSAAGAVALFEVARRRTSPSEPRPGPGAGSGSGP
ncbi:MAG: 23S rRNA (guanosine(2251)-2'-O)-methyltransferase RlmB [Acidimicrobiales bacterium]